MASSASRSGSSKAKSWSTIPVPATVASRSFRTDRPRVAQAAVRLVREHPGDILFHKHEFDVFTNPNVEPVLDEIDPQDEDLAQLNRPALTLTIRQRSTMETTIALDRLIGLSTMRTK